MHAYPGRYEDELTLAIGAMVIVEKSPEGGWWYGRIAESGGAAGWFPANHVRSCAVPAVRPRSMTMVSYVRVIIIDFRIYCDCYY